MIVAVAITPVEKETMAAVKEDVQPQEADAGAPAARPGGSRPTSRARRVSRELLMGVRRVSKEAMKEANVVASDLGQTKNLLKDLLMSRSSHEGSRSSHEGGL